MIKSGKEWEKNISYSLEEFTSDICGTRLWLKHCHEWTNVYNLGKRWEAYLYHSVWWNEQFPACVQDRARRAFRELHSSQCHPAKDPAAAGLSTRSPFGLICAPSQGAFLFSVGLLRCNLGQDLDSSIVITGKEPCCGKKTNYFFLAQAESAGWQLEQKLIRVQNYRISLEHLGGGNKHRAPWILKLFLQSWF